MSSSFAAMFASRNTGAAFATIIAENDDPARPRPAAFNDAGETNGLLEFG